MKAIMKFNCSVYSVDYIGTCSYFDFKLLNLTAKAVIKLEVICYMFKLFKIVFNHIKVWSFNVTC